MKLYCNNCFSKTEYKFSKPKFCPECGSKTSSLASAIESNVKIDSSSIQKIKDLENQLAEFKKNKDIRRFDTEENTGRAKQHNNQIDIENADDDSDDEYDYQKTQYHINNFKKNKNKSGIIVEKDDFNSGISFGQVIENSSNSKSLSNQDFKMNDASNLSSKTKAQILEEIII
jgi:hypothetical protein